MESHVLFAHGEEGEQEEDIGFPSSGSSSASDDEELANDAASSSGSTTAQSHFEMASLMTHLPIKRGLSKFFDGKSQSFASLAAVAGLEDLPKPPPAKRLKASRSCGLGLKDAHRAGKKASRAARLSSPAARRKLVIRTLQSVTANQRAVAGQPLLFA